MKKILIIVFLFFIASYVNACSYPNSVDCKTEEEVNLINQEWQNDLCTRDELGDCISTWTEEQTQKGCNPLWHCGDYSDCINGIKKRNCNDGCGGQKIESTDCCIAEGQCRDIGRCVNRKIEVECNWGCEDRNISYESCRDEVEETKNQIEYNNALNENQFNRIIIEGYPIIFIHGFGSDNNSFKEMEQSLIRDTTLSSQTSRIFTYQDDLDCSQLSEYGIQRHAEQLKKEIDNFLINTGSTKVIIVAHSMGGLTARYYFNTWGWKEKKVDKIIMFGTPNHGSTMTDYGAFLNCHNEEIKDLTPNSDFLKKLNSFSYSEEDYFYSIYSDYDIFAQPDTASLTGSNNFRIDDIYCDHFSLIKPSLCEPAYKKLISILMKYPNSTLNSIPTITTDVISPPQEEKICVKRFLGFLWCINWS